MTGRAKKRRGETAEGATKDASRTAPAVKKQAGPVALACLGLCLLIAAVYGQVGRFSFVDYDDNEYITLNARVSRGITAENIAWAFTSVEAANWHPLTWLSHMADVQLYGMNPRGHHLTSLGLHMAAAVLLLVLLRRLTGSLAKSAFVAALFGLHPLHVESVAWVAERKDVLCALFFFLSLFAYARYAAQPKSGRYLLALFCGALALMAKPMAVSLPLVMLILDFWPLERYRSGTPARPAGPWPTARSLVLEKLPFAALSLASCLLTLHAQRMRGAVAAVSRLSFEGRIENALVSYATYIFKTLWPQDLSIFYPFSWSIPAWQVAGSAALLAAITAAALRARRRRPYLAAGWLWFLIMLVPVIGLVQVGGQAMADRYTYMPAVGLFIMAAWGLPDLLSRLPQRSAVLAGLAGLAIVASAALSWRQARVWQDSLSLYRHALAVNPDNYMARYGLGFVLAEKGDTEAAIGELAESVRLEPGFDQSHLWLGISLARTGDHEGAIRELREAVRLTPGHDFAHYSLGNVLAATGDRHGAVRAYGEAVRIKPDNELARASLGRALGATGDRDGAIREYREALRLNPNDEEVQTGLAVLLFLKGDHDAAIRHFTEALRINPGNSKTHNNLGRAYAARGDLDAAIRQYEEALRINPADALARKNLEEARERQKGGGR